MFDNMLNPFDGKNLSATKMENRENVLGIQKSSASCLVLVKARRHGQASAPVVSHRVTVSIRPQGTMTLNPVAGHSQAPVQMRRVAFGRYVSQFITTFSQRSSPCGTV